MPGAVDAIDQAADTLLQCPITKQPLRRRADDFASADSQYAYPIVEGIARLLPSAAVPVNGERVEATLRPEKQRVQSFYDQTGWQKDDDGTFVDASLFLDLRAEVQEYHEKCRARVKRHLPASGDYLLDVASGPVHLPGYQDYSHGFGRRICVDLSHVALEAARDNLGDHGLYIVGDITNLPFQDGTVDAAVSLHTVYHVPQDEQATALRELHRVLKPGGRAVVVYYWQTTPWRSCSFPRRAVVLPWRVLRKAASTLRRSGPEAQPSDLYYHAHDYEWFCAQDWGFPVHVRVWSATTSDVIRRFPARLARPMLAALYRVEEMFPRLLGRFGYPMLIICKDPA